MNFPSRKVVIEGNMGFDQIEAYPQPARYIIRRLDETFEGDDLEVKITLGELREETGCSIGEILKFILDLMAVAGELGWDILLSGDVPKGPESTVTFS